MQKRYQLACRTSITNIQKPVQLQIGKPKPKGWPRKNALLKPNRIGKIGKRAYIEDVTGADNTTDKDKVTCAISKIK